MKEKYENIEFTEAEAADVQKAMDVIADALEKADVTLLHAAVACATWLKVIEENDGLRVVALRQDGENRTHLFEVEASKRVVN